MLILSVALALGGWLPAGTEPVRIPALHGTTFSGESVALPDAFHGNAGVLILGFSEGSRAAAADWGHRLADDPQRPAGPAYYELPVLEKVPKLLRGLVLRKIKGSVSSRGQAHFLPVLDHEAEWKRVAGFSKEDDVYVLIVDGGGVVRWRTQGTLTEQSYAELKRQLLLTRP